MKTIEILRLCSAMLSAIQSIVQFLMTISGLRRYPSKQRHLHDMPGRGTVTFLIVANVTVWICRTALVKVVTVSTMIDYYGTMAWLLIVNINLPLLLFFRFHSSVCLADIWHSAYTSPVPGGDGGGAGDGSATAAVSEAVSPAVTALSDRPSAASLPTSGGVTNSVAKSFGVSTLLRSYSTSQLTADGTAGSTTGGGKVAGGGGGERLSQRGSRKSSPSSPPPSFYVAKFDDNDNISIITSKV
jgi:hypothetical protein